MEDITAVPKENWLFEGGHLYSHQAPTLHGQSERYFNSIFHVLSFDCVLGHVMCERKGVSIVDVEIGVLDKGALDD